MLLALPPSFCPSTFTHKMTICRLIKNQFIEAISHYLCTKKKESLAKLLRLNTFIVILIHFPSTNILIATIAKHHGCWALFIYGSGRRWELNKEQIIYHLKLLCFMCAIPNSFLITFHLPHSSCQWFSNFFRMRHTLCNKKSSWHT